jgi:hypothetical protein
MSAGELLGAEGCAGAGCEVCELVAYQGLIMIRAYAGRLYGCQVIAPSLDERDAGGGAGELVGLCQCVGSLVFVRRSSAARSASSRAFSIVARRSTAAP